MSLPEVYTQFVVQVLEISPIDAVAVLFGMISVVLANRNHVALYPTGIISTALTIYVYLRPSVGLYAEAFLNGYYLVMSIYGWVRWNTHKENDNPAAITYNTHKDWITTAAIAGVGWIVLYTVLRQFTNSTVPVYDAIVSATAWAGMWLLAKHKIENWILLNISNAIAIPLLLYKGVYSFAVLTLFLFIVAIFGYFRWKKLYRLQHT